MKKLLLLITTFLATYNLANAQAPLENGKLQLNAGLGTSGWGTPIYVGLDYGLGNNITLGSEISYRSYDSYGFKMSILGIQGNANYHFNEVLEIPSQWDLYAGLSLNYYNWNFKDDYAEQVVDDTHFGIGIQIGGRYFFTDNFAINLEGGGGNATSGGKIGITYKF
ncbi:conserved exported hypothetical protein [Flavobacterium sp. 9AF]|uniref:outer membrane beta-barrel protein n=1 Tax=Flavobacterium sp. 9AF TaxID=2653142 RepID=UPI0012F46096|nr:outer membrane beta-barrel protein [Flavobacterium sp. 9AF]VXB26029.1 conserved exported hypothetical protein [Flavobacterium sp. 9AF]